MVSVSNTNFASRVILGGAIESGAIAWAAHALSSPIGAAGGALFGAIRYISQIPLHILGRDCLNTEHPLANGAAKTLAACIKYLGSYAIAWGVLAISGYTLTLAQMINITIVSLFTGPAIEAVLQCLGLQQRSAIS